MAHPRRASVISSRHPRGPAEPKGSRGYYSLGDPARLTKIDPFSRTAGPPKRSSQPWAHGSEKVVEAYRKAYSVMLAAYRAASERFRATRVLGDFPDGTFPPWGHWQSEVTT